MEMRMLSTLFIFILTQGPRWWTLAWEDDMFYITSFRNVDEWPKIYHTCRIDEPTAIKFHGKNLSKTGKVRTHHLSPIRLPAHETLPQRRNLENGTLKPLFLFTHHPPQKRNYSVSYGFQKNKECLHYSYHYPCIISRSLGLNRAVVLNAERESIIENRNTFKIEDEEKFVTLLNGEPESIEKKFYEAVFMGNVEGSKGNRSTHTIDGKAYPMEIYLFFVDESLFVMNACTVLVILVEESEEENQYIAPVVRAVQNHLETEERMYIKRNKNIVGRERTYHHMGPTTYNRRWKTLTLNDTWILHHEDTKSLSNWEKYNYFDIRTKHNYERYDKLEEHFTTMSNAFFNSDSFDDKQFPGYWLYPAIANVYKDQLNFPKGYNASPPYKNSKMETRVKAKEPGDEEMQALVKEYVEFLQDAFNKQNLKNATNVSARNVTGLLNTFYGITSKLETPYDRLARREEDASPKENSTLIYDRLWLQLNNLTNGQLANLIRLNVYPDFLADLFFPIRLQFWGPQYEQVTDDLKQAVKAAGYANQDGSVEDIHLKLFKRRIDRENKKRLKATSRVGKSPFRTMGKRIGSITGGNLGMKREAAEAFEKLSPHKVHLASSFQVSWLIPDAGGYYVYKGSSPLTPCLPVEETIVFRKPIKMSKEQIQVLTTVPTSRLKARDIKNTLGKLHPHRPYVENDLGIVYEDRAHQFLGNDDRHDNSLTKALRNKKIASGSHKNETLLRNKLCIAAIISFLCCALLK